MTVDPSVGNVQDTLAETEFTVVGRVHSPLYVSSTSMGTSTIGSGTIEQFMYVLPEAFDADMPYVEAYVSVEGAAELPADSDAYDDRVAGVVAAIEGIAPAREQGPGGWPEGRGPGRFGRGASGIRKKRPARRPSSPMPAPSWMRPRRSWTRSAQAGRGCLHPCRQREEDQDGEKGVHQGTDALSKRKADAEAQFAEAEQQIAANEANLAEANAALPTLQDALAQAEAALQVPNLPPTSAPSWRRPGRSGAKDRRHRQCGHGFGRGEDAVGGRSAPPPTRRSPRLRLSSIRPRRASRRAKAAGGGQGRARKGQSRSGGGSGRVRSRAWPTTTPRRPRPTRSWTKRSKELADAQKEIDDIEPPDWLVMDRTKNFGVVSFASDADRIDAIASFFPFIFFLVAALVALTTMTRMVEEERMLIGTFKALGYSRARITSKYLIYAALAAGARQRSRHCGALPGAALGHHGGLLHRLLRAPRRHAHPLAHRARRGRTRHRHHALATWAAAAATLRETPAASCSRRRPRPASAFCWSASGPWGAASFSWKVTFRNIFRYKRRLVMTCVGIAGCTALLLTGLGLQNSINDIIDVQYGELVDYNVVISEKDDAADDERRGCRRPSGRRREAARGRPCHRDLHDRPGRRWHRGHDHHLWRRPTPRRSRSCGTSAPARATMRWG